MSHISRAISGSLSVASRAAYAKGSFAPRPLAVSPSSYRARDFFSHQTSLSGRAAPSANLEGGAHVQARVERALGSSMRSISRHPCYPLELKDCLYLQQNAVRSFLEREFKKYSKSIPIHVEGSELPVEYIPSDLRKERALAHLDLAETLCKEMLLLPHIMRLDNDNLCQAINAQIVSKTAKQDHPLHYLQQEENHRAFLVIQNAIFQCLKKAADKKK